MITAGIGLAEQNAATCIFIKLKTEGSIRAGVDWLEVGTPDFSEGGRAVRELGALYPDIPIVAD